MGDALVGLLRLVRIILTYSCQTLTWTKAIMNKFVKIQRPIERCMLRVKLKGKKNKLTRNKTKFKDTGQHVATVKWTSLVIIIDKSKSWNRCKK